MAALALPAAANEGQRECWRLAQTITFTALGTAMRRGELLALHWRDIHLLDGYLQVREALVRGRFTNPKSRAGRRRIDLGPRTLKLLADHWFASTYSTDDDLVFCHPPKAPHSTPPASPANTFAPR